MKRLIVIYDGECALCVAVVARLGELGLATALEAVPLSDERAVAVLPAGYPQERLAREMHVVELPSGTIYRGADGIVRIVAELPSWRRLAGLYRIPGLKPIVSAVYGWVAKHRYQLFGRAEQSCRSGSCRLHDDTRKAGNSQ